MPNSLELQKLIPQNIGERPNRKNEFRKTQRFWGTESQKFLPQKFLPQKNSSLKVAVLDETTSSSIRRFSAIPLFD